MRDQFIYIRQSRGSLNLHPQQDLPILSLDNLSHWESLKQYVSPAARKAALSDRRKSREMDHVHDLLHCLYTRNDHAFCAGIKNATDVRALNFWNAHDRGHTSSST